MDWSGGPEARVRAWDISNPPPREALLSMQHAIDTHEAEAASLARQQVERAAALEAAERALAEAQEAVEAAGRAKEAVEARAVAVMGAADRLRRRRRSLQFQALTLEAKLTLLELCGPASVLRW